MNRIVLLFLVFYGVISAQDQVTDTVIHQNMFINSQQPNDTFANKDYGKFAINNVQGLADRKENKLINSLSKSSSENLINTTREHSSAILPELNDSLVPRVIDVRVKEVRGKTSKNNLSSKDISMLNKFVLDAKFDSPLVEYRQFLLNGEEETDTLDYRVSKDILKSRLEHINATTPFNMDYNPLLESVINNYVKYRLKYYPALLARAQYYFPIFEEYLSKYDIPIELKYLAIVESSLHPRARSRAGATGLWQFMYGTGKQFNLDINSYVDERSDPIKSTIAACKYLKMLYGVFNDWDLVLAAYNSGPGTVNKAIRRSGGKRNYWNIRRYLPRETAGYVPAFYAIMYIMNYTEELNILPEKPYFYYFQTDTIKVKRSVSFKHITEKTGVSKEVLEFLNPQYKMNIVPYHPKKDFSVRIPQDQAIKFLDKEQEIYALANAQESLKEKPLVKYAANVTLGNRIRYRVRKGDFLGKIARRFGVKIKQIKRWNKMRGSKLSVGQRLYIYPRKK